MLWDVITSEEIFLYLKKDKQTEVYKIFVENIVPFYERERKIAVQLVELNKKYILMILLF
jgi:hypothetical protein